MMHFVYFQPNVITKVVIHPTIAALRKGDTLLFTEVFQYHHQKIYFYILSKCRSAYIAEEVTQLTFVKLWQHRESLNESLPLAAQIFRIAKTTYIDILRRENRQALLVLQRNNVLPIVIDATATLENKELINQVYQAVSRMPPVRRRVFELSRNQGMSYKEISQALSLSVKTVETHMSLAIRYLRHTLLVILCCLAIFIP